MRAVFWLVGLAVARVKKARQRSRQARLEVSTAYLGLLELWAHLPQATRESWAKLYAETFCGQCGASQVSAKRRCGRCIVALWVAAAAVNELARKLRAERPTPRAAVEAVKGSAP